jgi:transposase
MTTEKQVRRKYSEAFKREAVALVTEQGYKLAEAARSVDVNANLLSKWRDRFAEEAAGTRLTGDEREELKELRKAVRLLKMEKDILKKASQYFAKEMR